MLGCLSMLTVVGVAIAAGLGHFSFWWVILPAFLAASFQLSNGPSFGTILQANQEGRLGVFPTMLAMQLLVWMALSGLIFWIASFFR